MVEESVSPSVERDNFPKPLHVVSVRELVEFVWRRGDLGGGQLFVGPRRALAGIRGHQKIQRSRPSGYQTEIPVEWPVETEEFTLLIRGRIDGLFHGPGEVWLEEIKTIQGAGAPSPDPLHWAQAKIYGFSYARAQGLPELAIRLTYLELETGKITEFQQVFSLAELSACVEDTLAVYLDWLKERHAWCRTRDASIRALRFPYPAYRRGQRELVEAAEGVLDDGGRLFLAAPTGIGKTISVLFPAIKALGAGSLERIFYLTARTVGRLTAETACVDLRSTGLKLRAVTLTAKEKVCPQGDALCDAVVCPLAAGYFDRNKDAMREALGHEAMTRAVIEEVARKHQVCPFELSLDVSVWCDAVICDYNYVFDPKVYLRRHFAEGGGSNGFLVDEAHNLVDRAREMFSADLDYRESEAVRRALGRNAPRVAKVLVKLNAELQKLGAPGRAGPVMEASDPTLELDLFPLEVRPAPEGAGGVRASRELPRGLVEIVETALEEMENWLSKNQPSSFREALLALYFRLYGFRRTAEYYDERFVTLYNSHATRTVRLFCMDPSFLLREALNRGKAAIFFSATLAPLEYFRMLLGGEPGDPVLQLSSPFPPENLAVLIQDRIQTHFKGRAASLHEVVEAIGSLVLERRGNYLVYFPSYQYLNDVLQLFTGKYPSVAVLVQRPGMTEAQRGDYLDAFSIEHGETLVGFAILGGIFGEGIDLVGERLIGAVIVGVGLPQLSMERDLIRAYFQEREMDGFGFAYTFPGMNRVLQAIGRVIRSETDRGVVLLIDARFGELRYRRLFPPWWRFLRVRNIGALSHAVDAFWQG
ncbi:MAG: ATP-dependent DNA helicase [bacterium]